MALRIEFEEAPDDRARTDLRKRLVEVDEIGAQAAFARLHQQAQLSFHEPSIQEVAA